MSRALDGARCNVLLSVWIDAQARSVALAGELDFTVEHLLVEAVAGLDGPGDITIDLAELTFIDASGLSAVVRVRNIQQANGFILRIVGANPFVTRVFGLGGLAELLAPQRENSDPDLKILESR